MERYLASFGLIVLAFFWISETPGKKPVIINNFDSPTGFEEFTYSGPDPGAVKAKTDLCQTGEYDNCAYQGENARWIEWNLGDHEWYGWGMHLRGFDTKGMKFLTFSVRGELGNERFLIKMRDSDGNEVGFNSNHYNEITNQWTEMIVPLRDFQRANEEFNLNSLDNINLGFNTLSAGKKGKIYIDNFKLEPRLVYGTRNN
ncbi:MAG: hypothetical protein AAF502_24475 [Bacteroidota bacterium]